MSQRILQAHLKTAKTNAQSKVFKRACKTDPSKNFIFFLQRLKKLKHPTLKLTKKQTVNDCKTNAGQGFKHSIENTPVANIG